MTRLDRLSLILMMPLFGVLCNTASSAEFMPRVMVSEGGSELGRAESWSFSSSTTDEPGLRRNNLVANFDTQQPNAESIVFILRCDTNSNIEITVTNFNDPSLYAADEYKFTNPTEEDLISGAFSKIAERRYRVQSNQIEITRLLYTSSTVQMKLTGNSKSDITGTLDTKGFKDAFDYLCVTSENYSEVSGLTRQDSINSPCNDPDKWTHCKKPKSYEKSKRSKSELRTQVEYMLNNYTNDAGRIKSNFMSAIILGPSDEYINGQVRQQLLKNLVSRDIDAAVELMHLYNLRMQTLDENVSYMGIFYGEQPNLATILAKRFNSTRVRRAVENNDVASVRTIMKGGNYPFTELGYYGEFKPAILLYHAIDNGYTEMVQLLLDAGANPNAMTNEQPGMTPLSLAIRKKNTLAVNALIEAGVKLDIYNYGGEKSSYALQAIVNGNVKILESIINRTQDLSPRSPYQWDLLMEAIWARKKPMIDFLIPRSDPLYNSNIEIENTTLLSGETLKYFPKSNALFLAQHQNDEYKNELITALEARATMLHGADSVEKIRNRAKISKLALSRGKPFAEVLPDNKVIDLFSAIIDASNVFELTAESNSDDITTAMDALLDKHQALVVSAQNLAQEDRDQVQYITDLGGWNQPLHEMLDILFQAHDESISHSVLAESVSQWKQKNSELRTTDLQEMKISKWIGELPDSPGNLRLQTTWRTIIAD